MLSEDINRLAGDLKPATKESILSYEFEDAHKIGVEARKIKQNAKNAKEVKDTPIEELVVDAKKHLDDRKQTN